ncbi:GGDEF domain-containing protein [Anaerosacchariphilus polymeriproducens]|uniref:GGDEF domain-containing protein n=1 Tax=Anaerosacchariphilus polymeriproducens TaxID=1812858 RepID=A0A371AYA2_9FIRM|nr:GGDEF domain-containing protein [Anaerosacchariphilus polymeriproducens]RDU24565.1 GGDEF domain-containing protein [Anaerosacchariphilus polymeriproducens]
MENDLQYKKELSYSNAKNINLTLLIIHILLFLLFMYLKASIMAYVNIVSITIYTIAFYVIRKKWYIIFLRMVYIEILIHMLLASIIMGWGYGFQLYSFFIIPNIYYSNYLLRQQSKPKIYPLLPSILTIIAFLIIRFYSFYYFPIYNTQESTKLVIYIINSIIVFVFFILYLINFNNVVSKSENLLQKIASYDELTQIYNRHKIKNLLNTAYLNAQKSSKKFCITILDIDNFKLINDTYGHNGGDFVLKKVASILKEMSSEELIVSRWGGEEFLILQTYTNMEKSCIEMIRKLREKINATTFFYEKKSFHITVTCGLATYSPYLSIDSLIKKADDCLYIGKYSGKNQVVVK